MKGKLSQEDPCPDHEGNGIIKINDLELMANKGTREGGENREPSDENLK